MDDQVQPIIDDFYERVQLYKKKLHQYRVGFCEWYKVISFYHSRMGFLINNRRYRDELIEYIYKIDPSKTEILNFLATDEIYEFEVGDVCNNKLDPNHIFY